MFVSGDFMRNLPDTWSLVDDVLTYVDPSEGFLVRSVYVIVGYDEATDVYKAVEAT